MAKATYTPTHCPTTGRKFTKAERRAANKAKFAKEQAKRTKAPKAKAAKVAKPEFTDAQRATMDDLTAVSYRPVAVAEKPEFTDAEWASMDDLTSVSYRPVMLDESPEPTKPKGRKAKKAKAPKASKARKATPTQRVADRQERAHHGKADSAVTKMVFGKPDADVEAAREAARNLSERKRFDRALTLARKWQYAANFGGCFLTEQQEELTRLTGHTGITTYFEAMAVLA